MPGSYKAMTVINSVIMPRHLWVRLPQFRFKKENWELFFAWWEMHGRLTV